MDKNTQANNKNLNRTPINPDIPLFIKYMHTHFVQFEDVKIDDGAQTEITQEIEGYCLLRHTDLHVYVHISDQNCFVLIENCYT